MATVKEQSGRGYGVHETTERRPPLLALSGVEVVRGATTLLADIDWTVAHGEHWAVVGPNGSGKTTLLRLLAGHLWPTVGHVSLLGEQLGRVELRHLRRKIGWVSPALADALDPRDPSLEAVLGGRYGVFKSVYAQPTPDERSEAAALLHAMGLEGLEGRPFGVLSLGERQRVLLARSLMARPRLLLLDEPVAGLDLAAREDVLQAVEVLMSAEDGPSVVLVTHHVEEVPPAMGHVLLLQRGRALASGPKQEVLTRDNLSRAFGIPVQVLARAGRYWAFAHPDGD
jgi:iron complex transport system ATP-binding protein